MDEDKADKFLFTSEPVTKDCMDILFTDMSTSVIAKGPQTDSETPQPTANEETAAEEPALKKRKSGFKQRFTDEFEAELLGALVDESDPKAKAKGKAKAKTKAKAGSSFYGCQKHCASRLHGDSTDSTGLHWAILTSRGKSNAGRFLVQAIA